MNKFVNKKTTKLVLIMLTFIMLFNFIVPSTIVFADQDADKGGKLFKPILKFFAFIGDLVVQGLQSIFTGSGDITHGEIREIEQKDFQIRYSPALIFSNEIPGLDANFINPSDKKLTGVVLDNWEHKGEFSQDEVDNNSGTLQTNYRI